MAFTIRIGSNLDSFTRLMNRKADDMPRVVQKALIDATTDVYLESRQQMIRMIYQKPIPTVERRSKKTGKVTRKTAWKRTGRLLRGEQMHLESSTSSRIDNAEPYAVYRHELNRPSRIDRKVRLARWRVAAVERSSRRVESRFVRAMRAERI